MQNLRKVCKKINGTLNVPLSKKELRGGMLDHSLNALKSNQEFKRAQQGHKHVLNVLLLKHCLDEVCKKNEAHQMFY
jgi:hypothetical protein